MKRAVPLLAFVCLVAAVGWPAVAQSRPELREGRALAVAGEPRGSTWALSDAESAQQSAIATAVAPACRAMRKMRRWRFISLKGGR